MRESIGSMLARVAAEHEAKLAAKEEDQSEAEHNTSSPERGIVVPIKAGEEKGQERRKLAKLVPVTTRILSEYVERVYLERGRLFPFVGTRDRCLSPPEKCRKGLPQKR